MNYLTVSSILIVISTLMMVILLFLKGRGRKTGTIWGALCSSLCVWGFAGIKISWTHSYDSAFFWWQVGHVGILFIPVFFFHFVYSFLELKQRLLLIFVYALTGFLFFVTIFFPEMFFGELRFVFNQFFWVSRTFFFLIYYFLLCGALLTYAFVLMIIHFRRAQGLRREQLKYFLLGATIAWIGGTGNYLLTLGVPLYPYLNILVVFYPVVIAYAIVKHRLMDVEVIITRTTIFLVVYSLVLGIPFALAFGLKDQMALLLGADWWLAPLVTSTVLATGGPFIYVYIQRRAEQRIHREQARYQNTLKQASGGMGRIKDLDHLLSLIVHIVTRAVRVEHSLLYVRKAKETKYFLRAKRIGRSILQPIPSISEDSFLIKYLNATRLPLVYDEVCLQIQEGEAGDLVLVKQILKDLGAAVVIPSFADDNLLALLILGNKISKKTYSTSDLSVFSILANQAALAIENSLFNDEVLRTHEQLFKAEKMATIGTLADGLSHQINNRLHALGFIAGNVLDSIRRRDEPVPEGMKDIMEEIEYSFERVIENVNSGGEIVRGLLKYSRKGEDGLTEVDLDALLNASFEMAGFKIKPGKMKVIKDYPEEIPKIKGNFTQLQEVFFNLIDNAYDAMMQRNNDLENDRIQPELRISAVYSGGEDLDIEVQDNGLGIKREDKSKLFMPFFSTKLSSNKGTGLGLYVIKKIIEENHSGAVKYVSKYKVGTRVHIRLPIVR